MWSINFFPKEKVPDFLRTKLKWVGLGSGLGLGLELVSKLVSEVVFWAFFEISLLITLEPHVGHTKFPDFYTFILDNNQGFSCPEGARPSSGNWLSVRGVGTSTACPSSPGCFAGRIRMYTLLSRLRRVLSE